MDHENIQLNEQKNENDRLSRDHNIGRGSVVFRSKETPFGNIQLGKKRIQQNAIYGVKLSNQMQCGQASG